MFFSASDRQNGCSYAPFQGCFHHYRLKFTEKHTILSAKTYHSLSLRSSFIRFFLRDFCTNSHEFEPKQTKNCRILQKNALFCAESAEKVLQYCDFRAIIPPSPRDRE